MSQTSGSHFSRRTFLTVLGAAPLSAANLWEKRGFPDWTAEDVDRVLTDSPWAKPVAVDIELRSPISRLHSDFSDVGLPGGIGIPTTGIPGLGWPGGGRGQSGGGPSGSPTVRSEAYLTIRWSSALPVRQAVALDRWGRDGLDQPQARELLSAEPAEYEVEIFGLPTIAIHQGARRLEAELLEFATLVPKDQRPIRASSAHVPEMGEHLSATLRFPRTDLISEDVGAVEFFASAQQFEIQKKFKLSPMVYNGRLEL